MRPPSSFAVLFSFVAVSLGFVSALDVRAESNPRTAAPRTFETRSARPLSLRSQPTGQPVLNRNEPAYPTRAPLNGSPPAVRPAFARENMSPLSATPSTAAPAWSPTAAYESLAPSYGPARTPKHTTTAAAAHKKSLSKRSAASHKKNTKLSNAAKSTSAKKQKSATKGTSPKSKASTASATKSKSSKKNAVPARHESAKHASGKKVPTVSKKHAATGGAKVDPAGTRHAKNKTNPRSAKDAKASDSSVARR